MKNKSILFFSLLFLILGCESKTETLNKEGAKPKKSLDTTVDTPLTNSMDDSSKVLFHQFFDESEQKAIYTIKENFDQGICKGRQETDIRKCYEFHNWKLRSDLVLKHPLHLNFPYNGNTTLDSVLVADKLTNIWTNKCGLQLDDERVIHYFCIDINTKIADYFQELAKSNEAINAYTESYIKNKSVSTADIINFIMDSAETLDFSKIDYQIFYMILHLSVHEERQAMKRLK